MTEDEQPISDSEIEESQERIRAGKPDLEDILCLVFASLEREDSDPFAPEVIIDAVMAKYESDDDFENGGADQFVWNNGAVTARQFGEAWVTIGASENGELLVWLADELDMFHKKVGEEAIESDPTKHFLDFRKQVEGPFFGVKDPDEEIGDAMVAWTFANKDKF